MAIKITGLDEITDKLSGLSKRLGEIGGTHNVSLSELLSDQFLRGCSRFSSLTDLLEASGYTVTANDIPEGMDAFISENTPYASWSDLINAAAKQWTVKKIKLAI